MRRVGWWLAGLLLWAACHDPPAGTKATVPRGLEGLRGLALEAPRGTTPIDTKIARLQDLGRRDPERVDTWIELGRAFVEKARLSADPGFYANAKACADVALELKPSYPLALSLRALVLMQDHRFREAASLAESILQTKPDELMALTVLSDALLELGEVQHSAEIVQKLVDLKPSLPAYSRAAYLRWLHGDLEGAQEIYRLALDAGRDTSDPEPGAWVATEAANMFFLRGDYEGAAAGFDHALAKLREFPPALLGKAKVALTAERYDEAARLAKRSFELTPLVETARVWGDAERAGGHEEEAARAYGEVVKIGRIHDRRGLALFYAMHNRELDEALKVIDDELKIRSDLYTHDARAWVLYRRASYLEAKAESDRAMQYGTRDPMLLYHAGAIAIAQGDVKNGVAKVKEALAMSPKFDPLAAAEARALLEKRKD